MNRDQLIADLTKDEGKRLTVYDDKNGQPIRPGSDVHGHPTIGIGRALDVHGITEGEAQYLLGNDIDACDRLLLMQPWFRTLDDVRQNVLLSMCFNLGHAGLLQFQDMIRYIQEQRYELAASAMEDSLWYRQIGARGARLATEMKTGEFVNA